MVTHNTELDSSVRKRRGRWGRFWRKAGGALVAVSLLAGGLTIGGPALPAEALPRAEQMHFPGGLVISNFKLPNGKRAYCIEVSMGEPSGSHAHIGTLDFLPGRAGMFSSYTNATGIRQMNYIIDTFGQSGHVGNAIAAQVAVWAIRGEPAYYNTKQRILKQSAQGQEIIRAADAMIIAARANAKAPVAPKPVTGKLEVTKDPGGNKNRYRVAYPKGVEKLTVKNGTWVRNGQSTVEVSTGEASARYVDVKNPGMKLEISAQWRSKGTRGWDAKLDVYDTLTGSGQTGQRVAVATGSSVLKDLTGSLSTVFTDTAPEPMTPRAASQAQPSADVGGTMQDTLIVTAVPNTPVKMWPNAVADFTAYLKPQEGAVKVDKNWDPIMGAEYDAQAEDPTTGDLLWSTWWAAQDGSPLLDANGAKIPMTDDTGAPTTGTAADGTDYPVQELDENDAPVVDGNGDPVYLSGKDPIMEKRRDPVTWTEEELAKMTAAQQCVAQPIYKEGGIAVTKVGNYKTKAVPVKSAGTIHWVERIVSNGTTVHQGKCGIANETTKVNQPAVITQALPNAMIGDELYDVATVSGTLVPGTNYQLRFEAFTAPEETPENADIEPVCDATNRVFRSAMVPVTGLGDVYSPSFTALREHGTKLWWIESLYIIPPTGAPQQIHRGECGLENETTRISLPSFETKALENAVAGDLLTDTLIATGDFATNAGATWTSTFAGYRAKYEDAPPANGVGDPVSTPVCSVDNRLFETDAIGIDGPGEWTSPGVVGEAGWAGDIWWVETVSLTQNGVSEVYHVGECGLPNETTTLTAPEVVTDATSFVAVGDLMTDTATITGPMSQRAGVTHEIVFEGYVGDPSLTGTDDAVCSADNLKFTTEGVAVPVDAELIEGVETRSVTSPEVRALPDMGNTLWWVEKLVQREGDTERVLATGKCGLDNETTTITTPEVRTESAGTVMVGEDMFDTAIVEGKFPAADDAQFTVTFQAYKYAENGELTCTPETELKDFEDATGVAVDKPGRYQSKAVQTTQEHIGMGGYVETLTMRVDDQDYVLAVGKCGAASEKFEVAPEPPVPPVDKPDLPVTGGAGNLPLIAGAAILLLVGAGAVAYGVARRRKLATASQATGETVDQS